MDIRADIVWSHTGYDITGINVEVRKKTAENAALIQPKKRVKNVFKFLEWRISANKLAALRFRL